MDFQETRDCQDQKVKMDFQVSMAFQDQRVSMVFLDNLD